MIRIVMFTLFLAISSLACAQEKTDVWPEPGTRAKEGYVPFDVIITAQPGVRHHCRVHEITKDTIVCGMGFLKKAVVFQREGVAALVLPPYHHDRNSIIIGVAVIVGCIAGSFFAPGAALPIVLRVAAGLPIVYGLYEVAHEGEDGVDRDDDYLLYQKTGVPLSITLHGASVPIH